MKRLANIVKLNFKQHNVTEDMIPSVKIDNKYYNLVFVSVDKKEFYLVIGRWNEWAKWSGIVGLSATENAVWYEVTLHEFHELYEFVQKTHRMSTIGIPYYYFPAAYTKYL